MNRPSISSELLVQLTSAAPSRVHKRLDKNPGLANDWDWSQDGDAISINTGSQTVGIKSVAGVVSSVDQIKCDCLLAPKCLHLLACVTLLEIEQSETIEPEANVERPADQADSTQETDSSDPSPAVDPKTIATAANLFDAASRIAVTGYERASTVLIGQLLQAAHHARAIGLHWPASAAIRAVEGIRQQRTSTRGGDGSSLRRDMFELLSTSRMIQQQTAGWENLPGTARRKYHPREQPLRLQGVFVEPILTDSEYAGMVVYLKDDQHNWFTLSDVRLGGAERLAGVWSGGISIGNKSVPASELINGRVLIRGGGVSDDGRLGLGQKNEFALNKSNQEPWLSPSMQQWLKIDLRDQLRRVWLHQTTPELARPGGWDLIGLQVRVLGASGQFLVVELIEDGHRIPLGINSETAELEYRRNLQRLASAPGMLLNIVARFDFSRPSALLPIAISPLELAEGGEKAERAETERAETELPAPKLVLPSSANGCWQLGWQRLQPEHFSRTTELEPLAESVWSSQSEPLEPLRRRIQSMLQGGHYAIPDLASDSLQIDAARFQEAWYETAAALLMELSTASASLRAAETQGKTHAAIERLSDLWIAAQAWCDTVDLSKTVEAWMPEGVLDAT